MDVGRLIQEVYQKKPIWDQKDPLHHNRELIYKFWKEIARNCGTTTHFAKSKWKNLRDSFRTEYKKILRAKFKSAKSGSATTSTWLWYKELIFLEDQMGARRQIMPLSPTSSHEDRTPDEDSKLTIEYDLKIESVEEQEESRTEVVENEANREELRTTNRSGRKRILPGLELSNIEEKRARLSEMGSTNLSMREDDCFHFLMSLHKPLSKLSVDRQMFLRYRIQELIYNEFTSCPKIEDYRIV